MHNVLVINGPNLNKLGQRAPSVYGSQSLPALLKELQKTADGIGINVIAQQSNHEGALVDFVQEQSAKAHGVIINPAALTRNGYALLDALLDADLPFVEVHISNIHAREEFRRKSIFARFAAGQICGLGTGGYHYALRYLGSLWQTPNA